MTFRNLVLIATLGSAAVLLGAYGFQHLGGLAPCKMCLWQRWPHGAAIIIGILAMILGTRILALLGALAAMVTSGIGAYHFGVEHKWWEGPKTCTSGGTEGLSASELLDQIMAAPVIRCDEIAWQFVGISMAGWNFILSAFLVLIWFAAFQRR